MQGNRVGAVFTSWFHVTGCHFIGEPIGNRPSPRSQEPCGWRLCDCRFTDGRVYGRTGAFMVLGPSAARGREETKKTPDSLLTSAQTQSARAPFNQPLRSAPKMRNARRIRVFGSRPRATVFVVTTYPGG
jgi:hypothetical protein